MGNLNHNSPSGTREPAYARKSPADRRKQLIEAAIRCLGQGGISAFTIDKIRKEAGVSRGLINHYFGSKDDLLVCAYEAMTDYLADTSRLLSEDQTDFPLGSLSALIEVSFNRETFDRPSLKAWLTLWGELSTNRELQRLHRKRYDIYRTSLARAIEAIARERKRDVDAAGLARKLIAMIDGLWLEWCLDPDVLSASEAKAACYELVEAELGPVSR